jgi:hypothetical protein
MPEKNGVRELVSVENKFVPDPKEILFDLLAERLKRMDACMDTENRPVCRGTGWLH